MECSSTPAGCSTPCLAPTAIQSLWKGCGGVGCIDSRSRSHWSCLQRHCTGCLGLRLCCPVFRLQAVNAGFLLPSRQQNRPDARLSRLAGGLAEERREGEAGGKTALQPEHLQEPCQQQPCEVKSAKQRQQATLANDECTVFAPLVCDPCSIHL